jgi:hypothetical protein
MSKDTGTAEKLMSNSLSSDPKFAAPGINGGAAKPEECFLSSSLTYKLLKCPNAFGNILFHAEAQRRKEEEES